MNDIAKKRALIIEDEQSLADAMSFVLEQEHIEVETCNDGSQAFERAVAFKPDVIVLDILLPGMDGKQVLQQIREHADLVNTLVFVLTNVADMEYYTEMNEPGRTYYFVKANIKIEEVVDLIKEKLAIGDGQPTA